MLRFLLDDFRVPSISLTFCQMPNLVGTPPARIFGEKRRRRKIGERNWWRWGIPNTEYRSTNPDENLSCALKMMKVGGMVKYLKCFLHGHLCHLSFCIFILHGLRFFLCLFLFWVKLLAVTGKEDSGRQAGDATSIPGLECLLHPRILRFGTQKWWRRIEDLVKVTRFKAETFNLNLINSTNLTWWVSCGGTKLAFFLASRNIWKDKKWKERRKLRRLGHL